MQNICPFSVYQLSHIRLSVGNALIVKALNVSRHFEFKEQGRILGSVKLHIGDSLGKHLYVDIYA